MNILRPYALILAALIWCATASFAWAQTNESTAETPIVQQPSLEPSLADQLIGISPDPGDISQTILGPRIAPDLAYGAFQRGQYLTALSLALDRLEQGEDAAAATLVGYIYENGLGVAQDLVKAAAWYKTGAEAGDANAAFQLATMYQEARGVPQNRAEAAELFEQAAEANHVTAIYNLALLHVEGVHRTPSLTTAFELMKRAAEKGLAAAQYDYGTMLIEGAGTVPDMALGAEQIRLAATQGLDAAQVDYATMLYLGLGVQQNRVAAVNWYRRAANLGNAVAQVRLAKLLAVGENVEPDLQTAAMWRDLARRQGLVDPDLERLLLGISETDLHIASQRALNWPNDTEADEPALSVPAQDLEQIENAEAQQAMQRAIDALMEQGRVDEALMLPFSQIDDAETDMVSPN